MHPDSTHEEREQESLGAVCREDCKISSTFMFMELMLTNVVTLALAIKIDLASNAAVLLRRNRSFSAIYPQTLRPYLTKSCSPIITLPLNHP